LATTTVGVDHDDLLEVDAGAVRDAAHLLEVIRVESFDRLQELADQPRAPGRAEPQLLHLPAIERRAAVDALGHRSAVLPASVVGAARDGHEGERSDHPDSLVQPREKGNSVLRPVSRPLVRVFP
jgi:hypothetical protein